MSKPVILTGIRSNDEPTIGNYLGAIAPIVHMANTKAGDYQINMFVPDLHSFTTPIEHKDFYKRTINNLKLFVAAGLPIEHNDVYIYRQSFVPAHSQMAWILGCFTGFGEASRMIEFKDKSQRLGDDRVTVGLFTYPILMAADILLYGAEWVPVGEDQRQHIELTRDLAQRMNNKFGQLFTEPKDVQEQQKFFDRDAAPRIRSLRNPEKKMSKSVEDPAGTILLNDSPEEAAKKVMSATTDSGNEIRLDWDKKPGVSNLIQISALLSGQALGEAEKDLQSKGGYGELKQHVADQVKTFLTGLQDKLAHVDEAALMQKLASDEKTMNEAANKTLFNVQKAVGLRP